MLKSICAFIFEILGWKMIGSLPDLNKFIIIVAPHTSNWDFPLGLLARGIMDRQIRYLGKKELFRPPFGWIFRALGGYPVNRHKSQSMVDQVADIFDEKDTFILALAPEGTRSQVAIWRTGFYHMAVKAKVPIVMVGLDYSTRQTRILGLLNPTGNIEEDLPLIQGYFRDCRGRKSN